jgi:DtxR family Mn-dependent transcriptional regulator
MLPQHKIEEILEAIWKAEEKKSNTLEMVRRLCPDEIEEGDMEQLEREGLVLLKGDQLAFTAEGKKQARKIIRRHRLTECLLISVLHLSADQAHDIACDMEHILPPEMTQSICTLLGHPGVTPDGKPIPSGPDCERNERSVLAVIVNLTELKPGEQGRIAYIKPKHHERSHQLASFGIVPGVTIELHQRYPAYCIRYEGTELALDESVAADIFVSRSDLES